MAPGPSKDPIDPNDIEIKTTTYLDPDGDSLRAHHYQEVIAPHPEREAGAPPSADDVPVFLIIKLNNAPVACGGLRTLYNEPRMAEIKRMYVLPEFRGRSKGIADLLMRSLESAAVERGWSVLRLATGVDMPLARRFYERLYDLYIPFS